MRRSKSRNIYKTQRTSESQPLSDTTHDTHDRMKNSRSTHRQEIDTHIYMFGNPSATSDSVYGSVRYLDTSCSYHVVDRHIKIHAPLEPQFSNIHNKNAATCRYNQTLHVHLTLFSWTC